MVVNDAVALCAGTNSENHELGRAVKMADKSRRTLLATSQRWHQDDEAQELLQWLSPADYGSQQSDFLRLRQDGTGQWVLDSTEFQNWCCNSKATLYCQGMPGAGKTVMTSIIVDCLCQKYAQDPSTGIAYIYCNFRWTDEQRPHKLLASILKQLILGCSKIPDGVEQLYSYHRTKETQPCLREIVKELYSVATAYSKCFIIVDALDECFDVDGGRRLFLSELRKLQAHANVNILATSRMIPEIARELGTEYVLLEIQASNNDVARYLEGQVHQLPNFVQRRTALREEVKIGIAKAVKGT